MSNNFITLTEAKSYTKRYRDNLSNMLTSDYKDAMCYSETFDASAIQALLNQTGCVQFRSYMGMKADNTVCVIFTAVDDQGEDILNAESPLIVENGIKCPELCSKNPL
jgi:hypothetical protein